MKIKKITTLEGSFLSEGLSARLRPTFPKLLATADELSPTAPYDVPYILLHQLESFLCQLQVGYIPNKQVNIVIRSIWGTIGNFFVCFHNFLKICTVGQHMTKASVCNKNQKYEDRDKSERGYDPPPRGVPPTRLKSDGDVQPTKLTPLPFLFSR